MMNKVAPLEFEKPIVELEQMLTTLTHHSERHNVEINPEIARLQKKLDLTRKEIYSNLSPWHRIQIVRHPHRPYTLDYLGMICSDFFELHGDRRFSDDFALIGGFATISDEQVIVIGNQKGRDTKENLKRNFGCAHPEGYRKALRLMKLADKFGLPILSLIDIPGAYPGVTAEERHVSESIAVNIREMFGLRVPILAVILGEGGSGGALGTGIADRILIFENAYYSVISPEGCASILWKDRSKAPDAAAAMKISAADLSESGIVDEIIPEPQGGAHHDWQTAADNLKEAVLRQLKQLKKVPSEQLLQDRYTRYRQLGHFSEG